MTRRSTPRSKVDDWAFPIRLRVVVPELGFGQRIDVYLAWLRALGADQYAWWAGGTLYFRSLQTAERFLKAFPELVLADMVDRRGY
jgi:hypothetical protein